MNENPLKPLSVKTATLEPVVRARIREYYQGHPQAEMTRETFAKTFPDVNPHTINHHLSLLLKEGFLHRPSHGVYSLNPDWRDGHVIDHGTPGGGRGSMTSHLPPPPDTGERRTVPDGFPFDIDYTGNTVNYLIEGWKASIIDRMRATGFPESEIEFISRVIADRYPPRRRAVDA